MIAVKKIAAILLIFIGNINCNPNCTIHNETEVLCSPSEDEYILKRGLVSDNNKTIFINLSHCRIVEVKLESFQNLFYLKKLDLSDNKIENLTLGVFDGTKQLIHLNLSYNYISALPLGLFDQKRNLEVLDIKGNKLTDLKLGVLDPFSKLTDLDLSDNLLEGKTLNSYIFDRSKRIKLLNFSGNDMSKSADNLLHALKQLTHLYLNSAFLTEVPNFIRKSKSIKHLFLCHNDITKIADPDVFSNLTNLEVLDLSFNQIDEVNDQALKSLSKLKMFILRNNKLTTLPDNLFQGMQQITEIDLSHNKIEIIPANAFRTPKLKYVNLSDNRFTYLQDNFVLELLNSAVKLRKLYINDNPWQCACLIQIIKEMKLYKVSYNGIKYKGKQKVCVGTSEFVCKRQPTFNDFFNDMFYNNRR